LALRFISDAIKEATFSNPKPIEEHMAELSKIRINRERLWDSLMSMAAIGPGAEGGHARAGVT